MMTYIKLGCNKECDGSDKLQGLLACAHTAHIHVNKLHSQVQGLMVELKVLLHLDQPVHEDGPHTGGQVPLA